MGEQPLEQRPAFETRTAPLAAGPVRGRPARYAVAVGGTLLAFAAQMSLPSVVDHHFLAFFPATVLAGLLGGPGPGLVATALSTLLCATWVLPAGHQETHPSSADLVGLVVFACSGVLVSLVAHALQASRRRVAALEQEAALRRAAGQVAASEARLGHFVEHAPVGVAMFDREMRYVAASRRWLADHHPDVPDVLGRSLYELTPRLPEAWREVHRRCLAGAVEARDEEAWPRHDGTSRWVRWECRPWYEGGRVAGIMLVSEDVTTRRRLEAQYRQAQKLEGLGRLAGGVAHDFNNLVTVILACVTALRRDLAGAAAETREDLDEIRGAAERARDLIRQLLTFARRQEAAPVALDLNAAVAANEKLLRRVLGEDVALRVEPQAGLWPIRIDPGQLEQVLVNLAVNARDAMPDGGPLLLRTSNALVGEGDLADAPGRQPGAWVRLQVRDAGCGMTPEVRAHLFEPFFTTKEPGKGTGLGLATVHGIVAQAGGHIHVESEPGRGTTFELCFPREASPPAAQAAAVASPHAPGPGAATILVVEDDPAVRGVLVRALGEAGFRVLAAADGVAALTLAAHHPGSLEALVTDVVMPGPPIREVVAQLRHLRPGLRVLYVSGHAQEAVARRGVLDAGAEFLAKPFTTEALLARVAQVLEAPEASA